MSTKVERQVAFRPRARLVSILGEHLISDQAVGLIELVKNAYDADATVVEVQLLHLRTPEQTTVVVRDNGFGMTLHDLEDKWLSPAIDHKERDKRANRRTPSGRLPLGEKGVGRFAVQQIGKQLELVSRTVGRPEIVLPIDWDRFESGETYLDTVNVSIAQREPELFLGEDTGTQLSIRHARAQWTRPLIEKVHRALRRLQSPLKEGESRFQVVLKCPEFPEFENVSPTDILERAHYEFQALIDSDGQCDFEYECRHPALQNRIKGGTENLVALAAKELQGPTPRCGPFWINLYVWDRTRDFLAQSGISARELNAQCGVSLFRDGLRVLPYGEPGDDWLLLDQERIQDPSGRIGNNQVVGLLQVLQEKNLQLRDKTNREGLIENDAFLDLKAVTRAAIRVFTTHWRKDRPRDEASKRKREGSMEAAKEVAGALKQTARDDIKVDLPSTLRPDELVHRSVDGESEPSIEPRTVTQREAVDILIDNIDGATATARETSQRLERLLSLAATGLAAERVVHEFGRQVSAASDALASLRRIARDSHDVRAFDVLDACLATLRNEFRILAPYEAVGRPEKKRDVSAREVVELAVTLNRASLNQHKITVSVDGDDFHIRGRAAALVQVVDNLVHNSCYWIGTLPSGRARRLSVLIDASKRRLIICDSGPGVAEEARAHLFEPFFSMKAGGTGLGLFISREILRRDSGDVAIADRHDIAGLPAWATGAVFIVQANVVGQKAG